MKPQLPVNQTKDKEMKKYYWKITHGDDDVGTVGPRGADETITENKGSFRMKDDDGIVYYHGEIYGNYDGFEPLDDFGMPNAGCTSIVYNLGAEWKQL